MPVIDPFVGDAFSTATLSDAINKIPNLYGRINAMNLFPAKGVRTRNVIVEEYNGVLTLLQTAKPGAPAQYAASGKRAARTFIIPHIPHDDVVLPEEVANIRAFGSENQLKALSDLMAEKLADMRNRHAITLEHLRASALAGVVQDADASTIYSLFTEYGISQTTVAFALADEDTEVLSKCLEVKRAIEVALKGDTMTGVYGLCDSTFFDAFAQHSKVKDAFRFYQTTQNLAGDYRPGFRFGGVTIEEYPGTATNAAGSTIPFIAAGTCRFFPVGTNQTFRTYFAPADFNEAVNTIGQEMYAKQQPREFDRGWKIHTQSNPLPLVMRPAVLVRGTLA